MICTRRQIKRVLRAGLLVSALGLATPALAEDINLGFLVGFTGDMGPWAQATNNAAMLAVDEINASGGILGRTVKLIPEDNNSTVAGAVRGAQKLVNVDKVAAIIGPESDPIVALMQFAKDQQIPIISTGAGTEVLDTTGGKGRYIYRTNASDSFLGVAHAKILIEEMGRKEIPIVVENLEGTMSGAKTFIKNFEKFGGKITKQIVLSPGQNSYLNEIRELADLDPDLVFLALSQSTGATFVKQAYQRGYDWKWWVTTDLQSQDFVNSAGADVVKGAMSPVSSQFEDAKSWVTFSDAYEKRFGEKPASGFYQAETYDAVMATALAIEAAGEATGKGIDDKLTDVAGPGGVKVYSFAEGVKEIKAGNDIDYEGASGSINFNEFGNVAVPAIRLLEVDESGNWVPVKIIDSGSFPPS